MIDPLSSLSTTISQGSTIDQLVAAYMALERKPVEALKASRDALSVQSAIFTDLRAKINELRELAEDLSTDTDSVFDSHTVTSSDDTLCTGTASSSAANGTYVLENIVRAKAHRVQSAQLSSSWTASSAGTFVINGTSISVPASATLSDVRNAINSASYASGRGVVATIINVDSTHSRLLIEGKSTGSDYTISMADLPGGSILSSLGLASSANNSVAIGSATASSENPSYPATNAIDGSTGDANAWRGATGESSWSLTLDLGTTQTVSRLVWGRDQGGSLTDGTPKNYTIEYWDGAAWRSLKSVVGNTLQAGAAKTDSFYPVSTSRLRITVTATNDGTAPVIDEVAAFNDVGTLSQPELQAASDASLTVNGVAIAQQSSNTIAGAVSGLTLNLEAEGGPVTLTVAGNTTAIRSKIDAFLTKLNELFDYLKDKSAVTLGSDGNYTRGPLSGYFLYTDLRSGLASDLSAVVGGVASGDPNRLSQIGITMDSSGHFVVSNPDALKNALATNPGSVAALFGGSSGAAARVYNRLEPFVVDPVGDAKAYLDQELESIANEQETLDDRIASQEERLAMEEQRLKLQYSRIQALLIDAVQQQQRMQAMFGYSSGLSMWG